jgi:hypothetical protein
MVQSMVGRGWQFAAFLLLVPCGLGKWDVDFIWPRAGERVRAVDAGSEIDALILILRGSPHSANLVVILDDEFQLLSAVVASAPSDKSTVRTTLAHAALTAAGPHVLTVLLLSADGGDLASSNRTFVVEVGAAALPARSVVGANINHDANFALTLDGDVACVLELERLFEVRCVTLTQPA